MRFAVGRRAPDEFVGDFDRLRIVGQPQIDVDRPVQGRGRRPAIEDELVEPVGRLSPITGLVQRQREIADAFLVAWLALEFFEAKPDVGIARGPQRQRAYSLINSGKDLVGIFVEIACNSRTRRCKQQQGHGAISFEHSHPEVSICRLVYWQVRRVPMTPAAFSGTYPRWADGGRTARPSRPAHRRFPNPTR